MKTIEDESHEFAKKVGGDNFTKVQLELAFEAGAEFMQKQYEEKLRWIPVDEELPEVEGTYLTKSGSGYMCTLSYKRGLWSTMGYQSDIKFWRSIDLK